MIDSAHEKSINKTGRSYADVVKGFESKLASNEKNESAATLSLN